MSEDFETTTNDVEAEPSDERAPLKERLSHIVRYALRRFVVLLSFGPGILGVLWLLSRILKR